jgi:hypothetical protein
MQLQDHVFHEIEHTHTHHADFWIVGQPARFDTSHVSKMCFKLCGKLKYSIGQFYFTKWK